MKGKIVWLLVACGVMAGFLGPSVAADKPQYGGELIIGWSREPMQFDDCQAHPYWAPAFCLTNEDLSQGDWTKGPVGSGEASWIHQIFPPPALTTGCLAESWELSDPQTLVFHIRKGVLFHDKPPVNGREMTSDDVLFTLQRIWDCPASHPGGSIPRKDYIESITAPDKYTVVIRTLGPDKAGDVFEGAAMYTGIVPRDAVEKFGDLKDWKNSVGTGPFMLRDYVSGSSVSFVKHPKYWMEDPLNKGNRLPYVESMKWLIIPDVATRLAALRTGKVDVLSGGYSGNVGWEDAEALMKTNPELQHIGGLAPTPTGIFMRLDKPELPWHDKRVRRALALAIDNRTIGNSFFGGKYELVAWPVAPIPEQMDMYTAFEKLPASSRELFEYNPEKARQLLAEAGFAKGFSAEIVAMQSYVDMLSIVKDYWSKIGVDLKIDVREYGAWANVRVKRKHDQMLVCALNAAIPFYLSELAAGQLYNCSIVDDPKINQARKDIYANYFDYEKKSAIMREINTHVIDEAYVLQMPANYSYNFWQPWLKNYHGEIQVGCYGQFGNWVQYVWLDQDMRNKAKGKK